MELAGAMSAQALWNGRFLNRRDRNACACSKNGVPAAEWFSPL